MPTPTAVTIPFNVPLPDKMGDVERKDLAQIAVDNLLETRSSVEATVILRYWKDVLDKALKVVEDSALMQLETEVDVLGAKIGVSRNRKWDYHDDTALLNFSEKAAEFAEKIKSRQKFLQNIKSEMVDTSTGELSKPATLISEGRSIKVTLPK